MNILLKDLVMAGVRWELSETSVGFMEMVSYAHVAPSRTRTAAVVPATAPATPMDIETANAMASRPTTMDALNRMILEFNHPLRGGATNVVVPTVAPNPNGLVIITDIPSGDDDASGKILSGAAGELLDKMLTAISMSRESVSILPLVFWRTPGGRTPMRIELDLARPFVNRAIELLEPRIILTLGTLAATEIAGIDLMKNHGAEIVLPNDIRVFPIYHPNYLILKPGAKADAWNVLQNVQKMLKSV